MLLEKENLNTQLDISGGGLPVRCVGSPAVFSPAETDGDRHRQLTEVQTLCDVHTHSFRNRTSLVTVTGPFYSDEQVKEQVRVAADETFPGRWFVFIQCKLKSPHQQEEANCDSVFQNKTRDVCGLFS